MVKVHAESVADITDDPFADLMGEPGGEGEHVGDVDADEAGPAGKEATGEAAETLTVEYEAEVAPEWMKGAESLLVHQDQVVVTDDDGQPEPPAAVPCEQPVDPSPNISATITDEETAFERRMKDAEHTYIEASLELSEMKSQLDALKASIKEKQKEVDGLALNLRSLRERGEDQLDLFDEHGNGRAVEVTATADPSPAGPMLLTNDPKLLKPKSAVAADAWRNVPIEELGLSSIKGLGKKKLEAIYEAASTIGELEDLRAEWGGLTNIEGIGPEKQTAIEDKLIEWLSANRDSEVLRAARGEAPAEPGDDEDAEADEADDEPADEAADHAAQVHGAVEVLRGDLDSMRPTGLAGESYFKLGYKARENDEPVEACPFRPSEAQTNWLYGWLTADHEAAEAESTDAEAEG